MAAATTITCTKSEFLARLQAEFVEPVRGTSDDTLELREVLNGLAVQADNTRGTFSGYSAYLDCDFTVTPDPAPDFTVTGFVIPAVTKAQAAQSYTAAATATSQVASYLLILTRNGELSAKALTGEIEKLMAAAGHLALAEQYGARK